MRKVLTSLLLFCSVLTNAAITKTNSISINIDTHQPQFHISLASNPTTGYKWTVLSYDKSLLKLLSSEYIASQKNLIGAGGKMQFNFKLIPRKTYPAHTGIRFKYARSWEPESGSLKTVIINFKNTTR